MLNKKSQQEGFTLIELVLATVFVSVLLISIVLVIVQVSNIYNRGLTLKGVDTVGREIAQHLRQDIARQKTFSVSPSSWSFVDLGNDSGRYCLGRYSYAWNSAKDLQGSVKNKYTAGSENIRLVKVEDSNRSLCQPAPDPADPANLIYHKIDKDKAVELIGSTSNFLALHKFKIEQIKDSGTGGAVYQITYILGTQDTALIDTGGNCLAPGVTSERDFSYCAINEFTIIARTNE